MRVLIACEESQAVCIEFRKLGHEAYSNDLLPCSGGHPEWHLQMDCFQAYHNHGPWDRVISFQPCTDLAVSGAKHFSIKRANGRQEASIRFFFEVWKISDCSENPIGIMNGGGYIKTWFPALYKEMADYGFPFKPSQIVQPYFFGDPFTKTTCIWLREERLPLLKPTNMVGKGERHVTKGGKSLPTWYNLPPSPDRAKIRSATFPGLAKAMAQQWGTETQTLKQGLLGL